jgi:hypothetical protein
MKKLFPIRLWVLTGSLFLISYASFSQIDNVEFLRAGTTDGVKLVQAYITPWANAFGAGVNGSWYNTAKPHKFGGFDITFGANLGFVPSSDKTFDVSKIGLTLFTGTGTAPTIAGPNSDGPTLTGPTIGTVAPVTFTTPPGTNWGILPVPYLQAGIGLPLGTELKVRYVPKVSVGNKSISSWGIGLLHSIMQYIPGEKLVPFDVSLFGGYQILRGNTLLSLQPDLTKPQNYSSAYPPGSFDNQQMSLVVQAWNISAIGSVNLRIITFYGGLGYSRTSTVVNMTGNYPLPYIDPEVSLTEVVYEDAGVVKDFPEINIKNFSGLRTNIGFRLKLAIVTIHADYTWAQYSVVSTGLGFSFR